MKRILVTAGGTATAWHISQIAALYYSDTLEIQLTDSNRPELVPAVTTVSKVHQVPPSSDPAYSAAMAEIIEHERIDCLIPLIPQEAFLFSEDSDFIKQHGIMSTAPARKTVELLADKLNMYHTLTSLHIPTPKVFAQGEASPDHYYLQKPRLGFGSSGQRIIKGCEMIPEDCIIQEYCHDQDYDEITVEVYNGSAGLHIFARRRIETKAGVCVKMEPVDPAPFLPFIEILTQSISCPKAFNVQFLYHQGEWKLFDCNLRLGAGTALSTAIGFQLTRALLAETAGLPVSEEWFQIDGSVRTVLRVYQEIAVR